MAFDLDRCISEFDSGLRVVAGEARSARPSPADSLPHEELDRELRTHAAGLMRVNHCGEVCAQALYQGQRLGSRNENIQAVLAAAASEETDHLAWSAKRVNELGGRPSVFAPLWYAGSLALGFAAGRMGDRWNLGFLAETERQVEEHLQGHLERLGGRDAKTRAVIEAMKREEAAHRRMAQALGARELPAPVRAGMRLAAKAMTTVSYWI